MAAEPFFTIGVPTFNRHDLLKQTLESILAQDFGDFEIIVGNDFTDEILTGDVLGIKDPRIRFINHSVNLREVGNMNALLSAASGRYFTWQFDDDLYEPGFLKAAHDVLNETGYPPALFPSFRTAGETEVIKFNSVSSNGTQILTGREYLQRYFADHLKINSTCGLFDTTELRRIVGGVEELCTAVVGLYCEYIFLVKCAFFGKIVFMDAPFVIFRVHSGSWGESNTEMERYLEAGKALVGRCAELFRHPSLSNDLYTNLLAICRMHLITFATKSAMLEVAGKKFGIYAAWRATARLMQEAAVIRHTFISQVGNDYIFTRIRFAKIQFYCFRLILFKLRQHWLK